MNRLLATLFAASVSAGAIAQTATPASRAAPATPATPAGPGAAATPATPATAATPATPASPAAKPAADMQQDKAQAGKKPAAAKTKRVKGAKKPS